MHFKTLSRLFLALALLLSHLTCINVTYQYCSLQHCQACSAPASTAFLLAIPYGLGIALCLILFWFFRKKAFSTPT